MNELESGRIANRLVVELTLDAFGLPLNAAQMLGCGLDQLQLRSRGGELRDGLLEIGVGHLVRVELRAVARQVEHLRPPGASCSALAPAASWRSQMSKTPVQLRPVCAAISSTYDPPCAGESPARAFHAALRATAISCRLHASHPEPPGSRNNSAAAITRTMREADRLKAVQSDRGPCQPSSIFLLLRFSDPFTGSGLDHLCDGARYQPARILEK